ncbi:MAG: tetratricopeptide repeat protein, partial [Candidatus Kariarchaeaceae archaeon]
ATHMGQLEEALTILTDADEFLTQYADNISDFDRNLINTAGNINNVRAITYWKMGELDNALHWHLKALEYRKQLPKKLEMAITYSNIATVYRDMGEGGKAIEYYEKAYSIKRELGNKRAISRVLFSIIQTALVFDYPHKVEEFTPHLNQIRHDDNPFIQLNYKITQALILKSNKRLRQKMESEKIFSEIVKGKTINPHLKLLSMKHLWEIYLDEYKLFGEDEVLQQINSLTDNMKTIASSIGVTSHYIEALILQSKLAELEGSYNDANKLLDEAEKITQQRKLRKIESDVKREKRNLSQSYSKWKGIIDSSTTIAQKMEMIQIKEYIIHAQQVASVGFDE